MASQLLKLSVFVVLAAVLYVNAQNQVPQQIPQQPQPPPPPQPSASAPVQVSGGAVDPLSAGWESVIGSLKPGFTCSNKVYGYYADINNDCKVFHVCWPIVDEHGATVNKQWTFFCGNATLFNQERLICDRPENVNCASSESFFSVNNDFGKIPGAQ